MKHKRPPIPVLVVLALAVIAGGYFLVVKWTSASGESLTASGTIEAVEITISPEIGGKVIEVYFSEGEGVQAGDPLFRLDDTLFQFQRAIATANLDLAIAAAQTALRAQETAEANYALVYHATRLESAASRTSDWRGADPAGYALPGGYFSHSEMIAAASAAVDAARNARDEAQAALNDLTTATASAGIVAAETRLVNARASLLVARDVLTRAGLATDADLRDAAQANYDEAQAELDAAQVAYDALAGADSAIAIASARADLAVAEEGYQAAQDRLLGLETGLYAPKVAAAQAALNQAVQAAQQAQAAVIQAEAALALVDAQIAKLMVYAPTDGIILTRNMEPGETVAVGAKAITLGRLSDLTITVYVPEDRYGELTLGQAAAVSVDSFPGETFTATVVHIADQAEFTPRNVQTVDGRASTVFAIRLQVQDPEGKLKPGMPADVLFSQEKAALGSP
ncbi:MAG: HlyD family efflux transporter periplasmic adaptor subunit [Chloroflexi bacterium]|nr:HlyD family efflux transporter periplasmic adaptor subunit [Chloroflexota bacterium]